MESKMFFFVSHLCVSKPLPLNMWSNCVFFRFLVVWFNQQIKQVQHNHIDLIGIYADQLKTHLYDEALGQNEALWTTDKDFHPLRFHWFGCPISSNKKIWCCMAGWGEHPSILAIKIEIKGPGPQQKLVFQPGDQGVWYVSFLGMKSDLRLDDPKVTRKKLAPYKCLLFNVWITNNFAHIPWEDTPFFPKPLQRTKKTILYELLVKGPGYLPGVLGWDLGNQPSKTITAAFAARRKNIAAKLFCHGTLTRSRTVSRYFFGVNDEWELGSDV